MNSRTQLVLVRHGESEWTERGLLHGGRLDSPLSPKGLHQAELTALRLKGEGFAALYSSPQGRAMQTSVILGKTLGLEPIPIDGLREYEFGWLEGKPKPPFEPDGTAHSLLRPLIALTIRLTGERHRRFNQRVMDAINTISTKHPTDRLLVVTHWGVLSLIMASLLDADPKRWREYGDWKACGISELHSQDGEWRLVHINDAEHMND